MKHHSGSYQAVQGLMFFLTVRRWTKRLPKRRPEDDARNDGQRSNKGTDDLGVSEKMEGLLSSRGSTC